MTEQQMMEIADNADMIVNGYAFTESQGRVRVLNLNNAGRAAVLTASGEALETSMDDIELAIAIGYYRDNADLMGA